MRRVQCYLGHCDTLFESIDEVIRPPPVYCASVLDADVATPDVKDNLPASWKNPTVASTETHRKTPRLNIGTSKPLSIEPPAELETLTEGDPAMGISAVLAPRKAILLHLAPMNDEVR